MEAAYHSYPEDKLVRISGLQLVAYHEILRVGGGNQYDMPQTNISIRQKENGKASNNFYDDCMDYSINVGLIREAVAYNLL